MASFNHHPYLAEVLTSLQKHQMHIESTSAGLRNEHPDHQQILIELPWKNETQEWAELNAASIAQMKAESMTTPTANSTTTPEGSSTSSSSSIAATMAKIDLPHFFERVAGTFKVDGKYMDQQWEDDTPQMKYALRQAGELPPAKEGEPDFQSTDDGSSSTSTGGTYAETTTGGEDTLPLPGNGKPIAGPRVPEGQDKSSRASCKLFSF